MKVLHATCLCCVTQAAQRHRSIRKSKCCRNSIRRPFRTNSSPRCNSPASPRCNAPLCFPRQSTYALRCSCPRLHLRVRRARDRAGDGARRDNAPAAPPHDSLPERPRLHIHSLADRRTGTMGRSRQCSTASAARSVRAASEWGINFRKSGARQYLRALSVRVAACIPEETFDRCDREAGTLLRSADIAVMPSAEIT